MRALGTMIVTMIALLTGVAAWADVPPAAGSAPHLSIKLIAETDQPAPGSDVTIALATTPQPGWHGYWQTPGDAGFPAKLDWTLPNGATAAEPRYPIPGTLLVAGLMNYVFEKPYAPLVTVHVPAGLAAGSAFPVKLHTQYLVCSAEVCVPESADLSLDLTIGDGAVPADRRVMFDGWRRTLPRPLGSQATYAVAGNVLRISIPYPAAAPIEKGYFFPITTGLVDFAAPQSVARDGDRVVVTTKPAAGAKPGGSLDGVLRIGDDTGLSLKATPGAVAAAPGGDNTGDTAASGATGGVWAATLAAFAGALLGGLILNIMPCVFPILSLKALSLARGHLDERSARREALAYAAGVTAVCLALGGAILALRAGGTMVGWAFQLQNPGVLVVLMLLTVALSLNLGGLFEIPTPQFVNRSGGAGGAFATGALAAFIATPCTGPFMGAALGAALVLPWFAALAVFAGLGIGLALPFLALGFVPVLRKALPKPGAWMETFRRVLSVPMWLTAIALAWVLGRQAGVNGLVAGLIAALAVGLLLWWGGRRQVRGFSFGTLGAIGIVVVAAVASGMIARLPRPVAGSAAASAQGSAEPFSETRLAALRAQKRPVFAYFTADWCLTCKVNEKVAIDTDATRAAFARKNVAVLVGDWTDGDPVLGRFIEAHNRAGVPLYLYYAPDSAEPRVLPQVLTPGLLENL